MLMASCYKVKTGEYVTCQVYSTEIEYKTDHEPNPLYWYIYEENNRLFYYSTTTDLKRDLKTLYWYKVSAFPDKLQKSGKRLNDVTVLKINIINNLK